MQIKTVPRRTSAGFTLIELMMVIVIVAVLMSIGLPAYRDQAIRAARAGAKGEMLEIASRQKQFLLSNREYASKTILESNGFSLEAKVAEKYTYDIELGTASLPSYTITFTPTGSQASDGWIAITSEGERTSQYPDKWLR